ncbi:hypothetical protein IJE86_07885 [bacterium]|nr:hypothetical protein [bacterium]
MDEVIMKCGHIGYGRTAEGKPYCLVCDCEEVADEKDVIDLTGRKAKCSSCGHITNSSWSLPFFSPREEFNQSGEYDSYYCGCGGWD